MRRTVNVNETRLFMFDCSYAWDKRNIGRMKIYPHYYYDSIGFRIF